MTLIFLAIILPAKTKMSPAEDDLALCVTSAADFRQDNDAKFANQRYQSDRLFALIPDIQFVCKL